MASIANRVSSAISSGINRAGSAISSGVNRVTSAANSGINRVQSAISSGSNRSTGSNNSSSNQSVSSSNNTSSNRPVASGNNVNSLSQGTSNNRPIPVASGFSGFYNQPSRRFAFASNTGDGSTNALSKNPYSQPISQSGNLSATSRNDLPQQRITAQFESDIASPIPKGRTPLNIRYDSNTGQISFQRKMEIGNPDGRTLNYGRIGPTETVTAPLSFGVGTPFGLLTDKQLNENVMNAYEQGGISGAVREYTGTAKESFNTVRQLAGAATSNLAYDITVGAGRAGQIVISTEPGRKASTRIVDSFSNTYDNNPIFRFGADTATGAIQGVVNDPILTGGSYLLGGVAGKGIGLAGRGLSAGGKVLSPYFPKLASAASNRFIKPIVGTGLAGLTAYGVDNSAGEGAGFINLATGSAENLNPYYAQNLGRIASTELIPFMAGFSGGISRTPSSTQIPSSGAQGTVRLNTGGKMTGSAEDIARRAYIDSAVRAESAYSPIRVNTPSGRSDILISSRIQNQPSSVGNPNVIRSAGSTVQVGNSPAQDLVYTVPLGRNQVTISGDAARTLNRVTDNLYNVYYGNRRPAPARPVRTERVIDAEFTDVSPASGRTGSASSQTSSNIDDLARTVPEQYVSATARRGTGLTSGNANRAVSNRGVTVSNRATAPVVSSSSLSPVGIAAATSVIPASGLVSSRGGSVAATTTQRAVAYGGPSAVAQASRDITPYSGGSVATRGGQLAQRGGEVGTVRTPTYVTENPYYPSVPPQRPVVPFPPVPLIPLPLGFNYNSGSGGGSNDPYTSGSSYKKFREVIDTSPNYGRSGLEDLL